MTKPKNVNSKVRFHAAQAYPLFTCHYGVFANNALSSMCYCSDKTRARIIALALNRFWNSEEGKKWLEENG